MPNKSVSYYTCQKLFIPTLEHADFATGHDIVSESIDTRHYILLSTISSIPDFQLVSMFPDPGVPAPDENEHYLFIFIGNWKLQGADCQKG